MKLTSGSTKPYKHGDIARRDKDIGKHSDAWHAPRSNAIFGMILGFVILMTGISYTTEFGQNKVQYQKFNWHYLQSKHFDIYYSIENKKLAEFAADWSETCYVNISNNLQHKLTKRIPILIYGSHGQFEQTNVIMEELPEGVEGFTEIYKSRVVVPFLDSYDSFKHVLYHELTHAMVFDLIFGNFGALLMRTNFNVPLWFNEGLAEYQSLGWDLEADAYMIDAASNGEIPSFNRDFGGFMVYKAGQSFYNFLAHTYGKERIGIFVHKVHRSREFGKAFESAFGELLEDVSKKWEQFIRQSYWPEVGVREEADDIAEQLTTGPKDNSMYNLQPAVSNDGKYAAFFSDRKDYTDIYIMDVETKKIITRISSQAQNSYIETFHPFYSGIAWSPDGKQIILIARIQGKEYLSFFDIKKKKQVKKIMIGLDMVSSPDWSLDGRYIVFSGLKEGLTDIYLFDLSNNKMTRLTADKSCDRHPKFSPDGKYILFDSNTEDDTLAYKLLNRKSFDVYIMKMDGSGTRRLILNPFDDHDPVWSLDGKKMIFVSNRNGMDNLYLLDMDSLGTEKPITNILGSAQSPCWAKNKNRLVFSLFKSGGWNIYMIDNPEEKVKNEKLKETKYVLSLLDTAKSFFPKKKVIKKTETKIKNDTLKNQKTITAVSINDTLAKSKSDSNTAAKDTIKTIKDTTLSKAAVFDTVSSDNPDTLYKPRYKIDRFGYGDRLLRNDREPWDQESLNSKNHAADTSMFFNDTLAYKTKSGYYKIYPYRLKFTPDMISIGLAASTYYGGAAQGMVVFSDILGNHTIGISGDIYQSTLGTSDLAVQYIYLKNRIDWGLSGSFSRNFTPFYRKTGDGDSVDYFFDQYIGGAVIASWPISVISRLELIMEGFTLDRKSYVFDPYGKLFENTTLPMISNNTVMDNISLVTDNILWGITGPVNGMRFRLDWSYAPNMDPNDYSFWTLNADFRKYFHLWRKYSFALRFSCGRSDPIGGMENPVSYMLGGDNNWLFFPKINLTHYNNTIKDTYFSSLVAPLRGSAYNEFAGTRFFLSNIEFRYPFIRNISFVWPLPIELKYINGALFYDMGSAWTNTSDWRPVKSENGEFTFKDIHAGFGVGVRINLGIFIMRLDKAWKTTFSHIEEPVTYFSLGAEF